MQYQWRLHGRATDRANIDCAPLSDFSHLILPVLLLAQALPLVYIEMFWILPFHLVFASQMCAWPQIQVFKTNLNSTLWIFQNTSKRQKQHIPLYGCWSLLIWWASDGAIQNSSRCSRTFFPFIWPFKAEPELLLRRTNGLLSCSSTWSQSHRPPLKTNQTVNKGPKRTFQRYCTLWSVSGETIRKLSRQPKHSGGPING